MAKDKTTTKKIKLNLAQIRFVGLYLGSEDGTCFNNATLSYLRAYGIDKPTAKVLNEKTGIEDYTQAYKAAKAHASRLVANGNIMEFMNSLLVKSGYTPEVIKRGIAELAFQRKNLPLALSAYEKMAKISGMFNERNTVNIPQLEELTKSMKEIIAH